MARHPQRPLIALLGMLFPWLPNVNTHSAGGVAAAAWPPSWGRPLGLGGGDFCSSEPRPRRGLRASSLTAVGTEDGFPVAAGPQESLAVGTGRQDGKEHGPG